jgi:hypothetical protein
MKHIAREMLLPLVVVVVAAVVSQLGDLAGKLLLIVTLAGCCWLLSTMLWGAYSRGEYQNHSEVVTRRDNPIAFWIMAVGQSGGLAVFGYLLVRLVLNLFDVSLE